jgi:hypothetical protein
MLQKYLLAFALGGLIAGGVVYFMRRPSAAPVQPPAPVTEAQPQAAPPTQAQQPTLQEPEKQATGQTQASIPQQRSARKPANQAQPAPDAPAQAPPAQIAQAAPPPQPQSEEHMQAPTPPFAPRPEAQPSPILRPDPVMDKRNRTPQTVTIPSGTVLAVRLRQLISTDRQSAGDAFAATLDQPIVIDGFVIADKGSNVRGKITSLDAPGRVKGRAAISLELTEINTTDGQRVDVHTDTYRNEAASGKKGDATKVGAGAVIGAVIGAMAGGGKGAAIGAGVGGAAGGGAVLATKGEDVRLTSETKLTFRLTENVTLTEKLN